MHLFDETGAILPVRDIHITNPELMLVIDHITRYWGHRNTITGNSYGPARLVQDPGFVERLVDGLYNDLARKVRGKLVLWQSVRWFYSTARSAYFPVSQEPDLAEFTEVMGDPTEIARCCVPCAMFAVQISATVMPGIPPAPPYDIRSRTFDRMMQVAARRLTHGEWPSFDHAPDQGAELPIHMADIDPTDRADVAFDYVTPERIRRQLEAADNQPPPSLAEEPTVSEHLAMRHGPGDGPYPLDFEALISDIDGLTEDD